MKFRRATKKVLSQELRSAKGITSSVHQNESEPETMEAREVGSEQRDIKLMK